MILRLREVSMVSLGKLISRNSEPHPGHGAGAGEIITTIHACPCGEGEFVDVYDAIPGFREHDYSLNCPSCLSKYNFNFENGNIEEK